MVTFNNTPKKGQVRIIVFRDLSEGEKAWYGVALDFNIVVSGESKKEIISLLDDAIVGYVHVAGSVKGLRDFSVLNQKAEKEYEDLWKALVSGKSIKSPYQVDLYAFQPIHA